MKNRSFTAVPVVILVLFQITGCNQEQHSHSQSDYPYTPVAFTDVKIDGGFWLPRIETNRDVTLWYEFNKCEETGRIDNFAIAGGLKEGGFTGIYFNDSDVFKVIEGAAYTMMMSDEPDEKLDKYLDDLISKIAAAQEDDGYLYTARTISDPSYQYPGEEARWSHLGHGHELYNVGHMYEAAVAHYQATGKRNLLEIAIKNADLICEVFGPGDGQIVAVPGHEEIEIGLIRLYRATDDKKYFDMAKFFIDMRGRKDLRELYGEYAQDHLPLLEQKTAVGHAVRGGYYYAGVADVASITKDQDYIKAIDRIWNDVVASKLYLTGNVGQHGAGEGYAGAYKLDNLKAYNETCAAIAMAMWNHRMFLLNGHSKYVDVLERTIYNGFLSGLDLSGDKFFYPNPLECDMKFKFNHGDLERSPWFDCSCCPVNIVRFIPSLPGYLYAKRDNEIYINLYADNTADISLTDNEVKLIQRTNYPWEGKISVIVEPKRANEFAVMLRIPGWAKGSVLPGKLYEYRDSTPVNWEIKVNGKKLDDCSINQSGYVEIEKRWKKGDQIDLILPMRIRKVIADERVECNKGKLAIERGPLVYCAEGADNNGKVLDIELDERSEMESEFRENLLGGVTVLTASGCRIDERGKRKPAKLTMIPYYSWCHRGANEMAVWMKYHVPAPAFVK
jgi:DUF1680 family protein